jgi:prepilin-type processing-associated H-X9-DG protein
MKGITIAAITDGTSNTALFAEVVRGTLTSSTPASTFDNTTVMNSTAALTTAQKLDGRNVTQCNNPSSSVIQYVGHQYYRALAHLTTYCHTLPPNWNKKTTSGQKYRCGDTSFLVAHIPAGSYHPGGANVGLADGSVRFVAETINFTNWQAMGTRDRGDIFAND